MRARRRISKALLIVALAGTPIVATPEMAWAQSEQDIAQARQLGQQAQTAYDAGNFAESEKLWAAAKNLYPVAPTLALGLARTQVKLGKFVAAQENYNKIIRDWSNNPSPPPAFAAALEAAKAEVSDVSAKIANVVITVEGGAQSPSVTIDGQPVPAVALGLKRPVDPGTHTVRAEAPGFKPAETKFQVAEGGNAEAKLTLEKSADAPVVAEGPASGATSTDPNAQQQPGDMTVDTKKSSRKTLAVVALGVGGAGLVVGAVTGLLAIGKHGDLEEKCPNGVCPGPQFQSDVDSYGTMGMISTIGFAVGVVGVGAGVVLWLTAPKEKTTAAKVTPFVGLGSAGFSGTF